MKNKSMEFFSGEGLGSPAKDIPPDRKAGPWLPSKYKSTDRGNVGESPWEEYVRRVNDARPKEEDIPHGVLVNGVVITLPRPRCKRETLSPQEIKPIHAPTREESIQKRAGMSMEAVMHTESPWEEYVRRVNDARPKEEDIPYGVLVNGVVITLPRPRCKRETPSPQVIKPIHAPTRAHRFSREEAIPKSPNWSMETAMQTAMQKELAAISQKMDTLRKAQEETNSIMRREMQHIKTKINSVENPTYLLGL